MEPERWQKIEQLYHSSLELELSQRAAFIEQACAGDQSLIEDVRSLLAQAEGRESFLEAPLAHAPSRPPSGGIAWFACWGKAGWASCMKPSRNSHGAL